MPTTAHNLSVTAVNTRDASAAVVAPRKRQLKLDLFPPAKGKYCRGKCQLWHPWKSYSKASQRKDGYQAWCKRCSSESRGHIHGGPGVTVRPLRQAELVCKACLDLAHRRPSRGCARCGEAYRPLEAEIESEKQRIRVGFGQGRGFAYPNMKGV